MRFAEIILIILIVLSFALLIATGLIWFKSDALIGIYGILTIGEALMIIMVDRLSMEILLFFISNWVAMLILAFVFIISKPIVVDQIDLSKPKIIDNSICGIVYNKPKCYSQSNSVSPELKYKIENSNKITIIKVEDRAMFLNKPVRIEYKIKNN